MDDGAPAVAGMPGGAIAGWLLEHGRRIAAPEELLDQLCRRLIDQGVPIDRVGLHSRTLHPQVAGTRVLWRRGTERIEETAYRRDDQALGEAYRLSPLKAVYDSGRPIRRKLEGPAVVLDFPVLAELGAEGVTDYLVMPLISIDSEVRSLTSWASRRPGGFGELDIATIAGVLPAFAALAEIHERRRMTSILLDTYLGSDAGRRVLGGQIKRGDGITIAAALWFCDLRDFTSLSDELPGDAVIGLLNDYFACMAEPVLARGGEVLKFIGDAMLAIFPIRDDLDRDRACHTALTAAVAALAGLDALNAGRRAAAKPPLGVGLALHTGPVMYGNIGAPNRLDFTVIGPAVNLVTRIESLCKPLGRRLLASARFASPCGSQLVGIGRHALKGIAEPQAIFTRPDA
jgi:adenylate cyclase